jgi:hypothetical protein
VLAVLLAASAAAAQACGYCVEDTVAAVYDYGLHQRTLALKHEIVFFAWDGPVNRDDAARRNITQAVESVPGVDRGSVRVSMEPAALALAFDPRKSSAAAIQTALTQRLGQLKLGIRHLQLPQAAPKVSKTGT